MGEAKRRKAVGKYPDTTKTKPSVQHAQIAIPGEAVSWEVIGDLSAHPKAEAVIELLEKLKKDFKGSGGNTMLVTLEAPSRTPVIKASVTGMGAFMGLISGMLDLGLKDRLEDASGPEGGVDAAFS